VIDTHSHILPGIDDGSPNVETSLRMTAAAAVAGVTTIVCTPHFKEYDLSFLERVREVLADFKSRLSASGVGVELRLGFEVDLAVASTASVEELKELTFEGSPGTMLVEMPHWGWPFQLHETLFRLRTAGLTPVLAHPERNDRIQKHPALLEECISAGAVAQATAASLDGSFGRAAKIAFARHLSRGHIGLLASDAHSFRYSSWTVAAVASVLKRRLTEDEVDRLVRINPGRLLTGEPLLPTTAAALPAWRGLVGGF
jgi:protein-tyrosine phosphatase